MKKAFVLGLLLSLFSLTGIAQTQSEKYQLSSHILDINVGKPAAGVKITLSRQDASGDWTQIEERVTDENGRVKDFLKETPAGNIGIYKLTYHIAPYFETQGQDTFYPL